MDSRLPGCRLNPSHDLATTKMTALWNGTPGEYLDLMRALDRHCGCQNGLMGVRLTRCGAHDLTDDQRALNGLLYGRRLAGRLRDEEWLRRRPAALG
jgi:hypothetical protein